MLKVLITGTFVIEPIHDTLKFWNDLHPIPWSFNFTPYNQLFQSLLNSNSEISKNYNGLNILFIRLDDLKNEENKLSLIAILIEKLNEPHSANYILCLCPDSHPSQRHYEKNFIFSLKNINGLKIIQSNQFYSLCNKKDFFDEYSLNLAHMPYSSRGYLAIGTLISREIFSFLNVPYKVIVLDCDNTLWRGICGEVGLAGITLSPSYLFLQKFMLEQQKKGMILCLASKNDESDVFNIFQNDREMVLKWEHIAAYKINWQSKSQNIKDLSKALNLGLESFIFIDDNPIECAEVKSFLPAVLTLQLPFEEKEIPSFLKNIWLFDRFNLTQEDLSRNEMYKIDFLRDKEKKESISLKDFIANLKLEIDFHPMTKEELSRVSQLTFRTNQFNFTTKRRNENDLKMILLEGFSIDSIYVADKFGSYGLVGVLIHKLEESHLYIDSFLLSCRVLGKGIEHKMMAFLAEYALANKKEVIKIEFTKTEKNRPAENFLNSIFTEQVSIIPGSYLFNAFTLCKLQFDPNHLIVYEPLLQGSKSQHNLISDSRIETIYNFIAITTKLKNIKLLEKAINGKFYSHNPSIDFISPKNSLQKELLKIWKNVLNIDQISIVDCFFSLGGDSMNAILLISKIAKKLKIYLTPQEFYQNSSIEKLSYYFSKRNYSNINFKKSDIDSFSLSIQQESLWLSSELLEEKAAYNVPIAFQINGNLNLSYFEKALNQVIQKHEVFHIHLELNNEGIPIQKLMNYFPIELEILKIKNCSYEIMRVLHELAWKPFEILNSFLFRISFFEIEDKNYIFLIVFHHLIIDERSLSIFFEELNKNYQFLVDNNDPIILEELPLQYKDFCLWQKKNLDKYFSQNKSFWNEKLLGATTKLDLPIDFLSSKRQSKKILSYTHLLSKDIFENLKILAKNQSSTFFTVLLASFLTFLHRYSNQNDILIGSPISERIFSNFNEIIGLFSTLIPIRVKFTSKKTFIQLLDEIKIYIQEASTKQDIPLYQIFDLMQRNYNEQLLFETIFLLRNSHENLNIKNISIQKIKLLPQFSAFDLTVIVEIISDNLCIHFEYANDLFHENSIQRMAQAFEILLHQIILKPHLSMEDFSLITEKEKKLMIEWNQTKNFFSSFKTIDQFLSSQSNRNVNAIIGEKVSLTYKQLNRRANAIVNLLSCYKLTSNSIVAICYPRDEDFISIIFAILKSGAAFLLLDSSYPENYLNQLLTLSNSDLLIVHPFLKSKFHLYEGPLYSLETESIEGNQNLNFNTKAKPNDIAYLIYTSGSSGVPKGVRIEHHSVCNMAQSLGQKFYINEKSRFLQFSSQSFDAIIAEIFVTLLNGATLVLISSEDRLSPIKTDRQIKKFGVTTVTLTPSFLKAADTLELPGVKTLILAGEVNDQLLIDRWSRKLKLINAYGPTESTVCATVYEYDRSTKGSPFTIGKAIDNIKTYILDEYLKPVSIGVKGELYIGGEGVARDYFNLQDLTAQFFLKDPYSNDLNAKIYKTGDLARFLEDGNIEFLGRKDHQVKIFGQRIELQQIENSLLTFPNIKHAVVLYDEKSKIQKLIAYLTLKDKKEFTSVENIKNKLSKMLPKYMIPQYFIILDSLPYLNNGKIDRLKLSQHSKNVKVSNNNYVPPCSMLEFQLVEIWEEILDKKNVGVLSNLFHVGGTSIQLIQIVSKVYKIFNVGIDINLFSLNPTIRGVANLISNKKDINLIDKQLLRIQPNGKKAPLFLIHPSTGLAFSYLPLKNYSSERPIYGLNNPFFGKNHFGCLKKMASYYIEIIKTISPKGPYCLGGWSFGGNVAFEMAKQLQNLGEEVEILLLIDSYSNISNENLDHKLILQEHEIDINSNIENHLLTEIENNSNLLMNYIPSNYNGKTILLKACDINKESPCNGWSPYISSKLEIYPLKGSHHALFNKDNIIETINNIKKVL